MHRRALSTLRSLQPDLVYVADPRLVLRVDGAGFTIASDTKMVIGVANTLAVVTPDHPATAGLADAESTPWVKRQTSEPAAGRHRGKRVVLCYHPTDTTPARYLHAALTRAGVEVDHRYPGVDLSAVDAGTDGVVFVESPYPAMDVSGETVVPAVYWVHHGEIHLYQNIRLAHRYRADAVLLAHSWHLAHRFSGPVFRFPFGVPTEMLAESVPFDNRSLDVSMVAAGFDDAGGRYVARRELASAMTEALGGERVLFAGGRSPDEMFSTYARSKAVVDEGGSLHRPITMRVFEATGSGAALITDPAPGIDLLFNPDSEYIPLDTADPVASLQSPDTLKAVAMAGRTRALGAHTYDHRVDELFTILDRVVPVAAVGVPLSRGTAEESCDDAGGSAKPTGPRAADFLAAVARFAEIDSIVCSEACSAAFAQTSYLVLSHSEVTARQMTVDAVVVDDGSTPTDGLLQRAHRYVFSSTKHASTVATMLTDADRTYTESTEGDVHIFDFATPGYIVRDTP